MKKKLVMVAYSNGVKPPPNQSKCPALIKVYHKGASSHTFDKPFVIEYEEEIVVEEKNPNQIEMDL